MERKIYYYLDKVERLVKGEPTMPVSVEIDPTNRCQLMCDFCMFAKVRESNPKDLPMDLYRYLLLDLKKVFVRSITFTGGGEPTLHKNFHDMVDYAIALGFEVGLVTNGLRIDGIPRPDRFKFIRVSLDAATPEVYHKVKGVACFERVISNIKIAKSHGALVGISFVVNETNKVDIPKAQELAKELDVAYIQFKPAWYNGSKYDDYVIPGVQENKTIRTDRYVAVDDLPCAIAGLVGIVCADGKVYYCCQYRGIDRFCLGDLRSGSFADIWDRRVNMHPDFERCPHCRYMNYAKAYKDLVEGGTMFFKHRNFL